MRKCDTTSLGPVLYASAGPFNITGNLGFETLLVFSPFSFDVHLWAGVALRRGAHVLAGIHFDGHLSGPRSWRIDGEACLSLWFLDLCVSVHHTFGGGAAVSLPRQNVWQLLQDALRQPASWSGELPSGSRSVAAAPVAGADAAVRIDPGAALVMRQRVAPLDRTISRFGHARPEGPDRFAIGEVEVGSAHAPHPDDEHWTRTPVTDWFAPAEFEEMSEADKLSRPGFERMVAGARVGGEAVCHGDELRCPLEYDTSRFVGGVRYDAPPYRPATTAQLDDLQLAINARPPSRATGLGAYAPPPGTAPLFVLAEETFVIATTDTLDSRVDLGAPARRSEAEAALRRHLAAHPTDASRLQIVPAFAAAA